jgi:hypothetical protein
MINITGDVSRLQRKINRIAQGLENKTKNLIDKLLDVGMSEAEKYALQGYSADGNTDTYLDQVSAFGAGKLTFNGSDVAYQEFGYGLAGKSGMQNPKQPSLYQQGNRDKWWYYDPEYGYKRGGRMSVGMVAQMPMYNASKAMREAIPELALQMGKEIASELK